MAAAEGGLSARLALAALEAAVPGPELAAACGELLAALRGGSAVQVDRLCQQLPRLSEEQCRSVAAACTPLRQGSERLLEESTSGLNGWLSGRSGAAEELGSDQAALTPSQRLFALLRPLDVSATWLRCCYRYCGSADLRVRFLFALASMVRAATALVPQTTEVAGLVERLANGFFRLSPPHGDVLDRWLDARLERYEAAWLEAVDRLVTLAAPELEQCLVEASHRALPIAGTENGERWVSVAAWPMACCPFARAFLDFAAARADALGAVAGLRVEDIPRFALRPQVLLRLLAELGPAFEMRLGVGGTAGAVRVRRASPRRPLPAAAAASAAAGPRSSAATAGAAAAAPLPALAAAVPGSAAMRLLMGPVPPAAAPQAAASAAPPAPAAGTPAVTASAGPAAGPARVVAVQPVPPEAAAEKSPAAEVAVPPGSAGPSPPPEPAKAGRTLQAISVAAAKPRAPLSLGFEAPAKAKAKASPVAAAPVGAASGEGEVAAPAAPSTAAAAEAKLERRRIDWKDPRFLELLVRRGLAVDADWKALWQQHCDAKFAPSDFQVLPPKDVLAEFVERNLFQLLHKSWAKDLMYKKQGEDDALPEERYTGLCSTSPPPVPPPRVNISVFEPDMTNAIPLERLIIDSAARDRSRSRRKQKKESRRNKASGSSQSSLGSNVDPASAPPLDMKTRICYGFLEGKCARNDCQLAHSEAELRAPGEARREFEERLERKRQKLEKQRGKAADGGLLQGQASLAGQGRLGSDAYMAWPAGWNHMMGMHAWTGHAGHEAMMLNPMAMMYPQMSMMAGAVHADKKSKKEDKDKAKKKKDKDKDKDKDKAKTKDRDKEKVRDEEEFEKKGKRQDGEKAKSKKEKKEKRHDEVFEQPSHKKTKQEAQIGPKPVR